jgi:hypothetical protein
MRGSILSDSARFEAILDEAHRSRTCAECGVHLDHRAVPRSPFCCRKCRDAFRHRRRYAEDPEGARARARDYYWRNRTRVLEKAAARRGVVRPPERTTCEECSNPLPAGRRVVCSERCRDRRYRRLHPVEYAAKEARKVERRRARRRELRESTDTVSLEMSRDGTFEGEAAL